jgi:hypothetical protein
MDLFYEDFRTNEGFFKGTMPWDLTTTVVRGRSGHNLSEKHSTPDGCTIKRHCAGCIYPDCAVREIKEMSR